MAETSEANHPLWEVLQEACANNPDNPGVPDMVQSDWAIVFKVIADHFFPEEPEFKPLFPNLGSNPVDLMRQAQRAQRQASRVKLLYEAEVAGGQ